MSLFSEKLKSLGYASYIGYLKSDHWKQFKQKYRESSLPKTCAVCGDRPIQLHHTNYSRLGCEDVKDVTPLCRHHHEMVHDWLKAHRKLVNATHLAVAFLKKKSSKPKVAPEISEKKRAKRKTGKLSWKKRVADQKALFLAKQHLRKAHELAKKEAARSLAEHRRRNGIARHR